MFGRNAARRDAEKMVRRPGNGNKKFTARVYGGEFRGFGNIFNRKKKKESCPLNLRGQDSGLFLAIAGGFDH